MHANPNESAAPLPRPAHGAASEGPDAGAAAATPGAGNERLVRLPDALQVVSLGRTAWLDLVKSGQAPRPVKIGRATFWVWSELQSFIADRIRQSRGG